MEVSTERSASAADGPRGDPAMNRAAEPAHNGPYGRSGQGSSWGQTWDVWPGTAGPMRLPGGGGTV